MMYMKELSEFLENGKSSSNIRSEVCKLFLVLALLSTLALSGISGDFCGALCVCGTEFGNLWSREGQGCSPKEGHRFFQKGSVI